MKEFAYSVYLSEIVFQVKIAQCAASRLPVNPGNFNHLEVWCSIQSILVSSANVSKILWPISKKSQQRGKELRELLGIDETNILANRNIRNHFEHYDERIERLFEGQSSIHYIDLAFNPFKPEMWGIPKYYERAYNQVDKILTFRNETLDLKEVLLALENLKIKCSGYIYI